MSGKLDGKNVIIRPMQADDLSQVEALDRACFSDPWPAGAFAYELENPQNAILLVAEDGGLGAGAGVVGAAVLWLAADEVQVGTIGILPAYRGRKLGLRLLAQGLVEAAERGAARSFLEVRASNQSALRLYYGLGYQAVGLRPRYYKDNNEDALLLSLEGLDAGKLRDMLGNI